MIELDERIVRPESDAFHARYRLATDHDQDQLRVWQLFSPALVDWLTVDAPGGFSFELQEGGLTCFVSGTLTEPEALDELCQATERVRDRVVELSEGAPPTKPVGRTRAGIVDAELAKHRFASPPRSVFAAARAFGWAGLISGRSWRLGTEAFFREYGRAIDHDAYFLSTKHEDRRGLGWSVLVVDVGNDANTFQFAGMPETAAAERKGIEITGGNGEQIVWKADGGAIKRTRRRLDVFFADASELLAAVIAAGRPRSG